MKYAIGCGMLAGAILSAPLHADEIIVVTPASIIAFGQGDGDTFGIESAGRDTALILIKPQGEDCTLRFPLRVGENLLLRATSQDGQPLVCQASLTSIDQAGAAQFSSRCFEQRTQSQEPKCPSVPASAEAVAK